jgi:signal transduction histidine kinase
MSLPLQLTTYFASPERLSLDDVRHQTEYFAQLTHLREFLDAMPIVFVVLNQHRQVVYANQTLLDGLKVTERDALNGQRPGEILDCVHSHENDAGCGTSEFCKTCGAVRTILTSLQGRKATAECRITQRDGTALDLRVSGSPLTVGDQRFSLFAVEDISHQKRRAVLERLFFHDVLNEAGVALGCAHLLQDEPAPNERVAEFRAMLTGSVERMIDEIKTQRELSAAENGDLVVRPVPMSAFQVLEYTLQHYALHAVGRERKLMIAPGSADTVLVCDPQLIERVVGNLVKNALEAVSPGSTVTLACYPKGDRVVFSVHNPGVIPRDTQLQLFQRSFTTKGTGRGMGTYSVKLLTERYLAGQVSFTSTEREGTTFRVTIPRGMADRQR